MLSIPLRPILTSTTNFKNENQVRNSLVMKPGERPLKQTESTPHQVPLAQRSRCTVLTCRLQQPTYEMQRNLEHVKTRTPHDNAIINGSFLEKSKKTP